MAEFKLCLAKPKLVQRRAASDFGIFYEIQVNSPLKHREREAEVFHQVLEQVALAEGGRLQQLLERRAPFPARLLALLGARSALRSL